MANEAMPFCGLGPAENDREVEEERGRDGVATYKEKDPLLTQRKRMEG